MQALVTPDCTLGLQAVGCTPLLDVPPGASEVSEGRSEMGPTPAVLLPLPMLELTPGHNSLKYINKIKKDLDGVVSQFRTKIFVRNWDSTPTKSYLIL